MPAENLPMGQTTTYSVEVAHNRSEGIFASPIAGNEEENCSLVRLHSPFELMSLYWSCVSIGKPPLVPSPKVFYRNGNRVFIGGERHGVMTPDIVGHIFQMAGRLDFVVVAPEGLDSQFCLAMCPWEQASPMDFYIPEENFLDQGIVNDNWLQPVGVEPDPVVPLLNMISP